MLTWLRRPKRPCQGEWWSTHVQDPGIDCECRWTCCARGIGSWLRALERELVELDSARRSAAMTDARRRSPAARRARLPSGRPRACCRRAWVRALSSIVCSLARSPTPSWVPRSIWMRGRSDVRAALEAITELRIRVHYPLIEAEVAQREQVAIVDAAGSGSRTPGGARGRSPVAVLYGRRVAGVGRPDDRSAPRWRREAWSASRCVRSDFGLDLCPGFRRGVRAGYAA